VPASLRSYHHSNDYLQVGEFLVRTYRTTGEHINWLQPRWEYMHYHPLIENVDLAAIGIWEREGKIVAVAHPEHGLGTVYFQIDPAFSDDPAFSALKPEMLAYAAERLYKTAAGVRRLRIYINDEDRELQALASEAGYTKTAEDEPMSQMHCADLAAGRPLPEGFRLQSLREENDLRKVHGVMWRGFGHGDDPPEDGIEERRQMQSAPNFREELQIVAVAPDGNYAAYCGMWYEPVNRFAYVEPVCTDPAFRRLGLARAATVEGIRRCRDLGAEIAYVGATLPVYLSLGFRECYNCTAWLKEWS